MKRYYLLLFFALTCTSINAQTINAAYVKALYKKYLTRKSDLCPSCKLWVNPYYKSVADTDRHMPLVTYYIYTKAHRLEQENANVPRNGVYAAWHSAYGQSDETKVYKQANVESPDMIAKGHCQAWILLAYDADGAILSDTYTFNAGMEYRGQNIGTEIATEELCRKLTNQTDSVRIWCGTSGNQRTYTKNTVTVTMPSHYYKIIKYNNKLLCYWMPNLPTEKRALLTQRMVNHEQLVANLGFDPMMVFKE
ncbi:DNA/RNA non-specific endonuclease [Mucilaginibacter sp.]|uniref:DNA/RNA non-specific endonuclease n=1 Tax=Mucilaginibacter sp. TaxID=1882438 RepID=UPI0026208801|nr:DNA/RNA non-specific endonuclease [Mucilaginibacter sp.]MDB4919353.1 non-specific endonuclease [Mucilaginibacter sp.]